MQHSDFYRSRTEKVAKEKAVSFEGEAEEGLKMPKHFPLANTKPLCRFLLQGVRRQEKRAKEASTYPESGMSLISVTVTARTL